METNGYNFLRRPGPTWGCRANDDDDASICLYFMHITCKKSTTNLKLTDRLIVSPDTSTLLSIASCADWLDYRIRKPLDRSSDWLPACVLSMTEWSVSNIATRILIRTHKQRTANETLPPLRIFVSRNTWHPFAEPSWRNNELDENQTCFNILDEPGT
jgi:hypothetical protein